MQHPIQVTHVAAQSNKAFTEFVTHFESQLGRLDVATYQAMLKIPNNNPAVERYLEAQAGSSGLMIFAVYEHGELLAIKGLQRQARQYVVGNPLVAARMTKHDLRAALYAPLRVLVYANETGQARVEYDLPSSLFGQFGNSEVDLVAKELITSLPP